MDYDDVILEFRGLSLVIHSKTFYGNIECMIDTESHIGHIKKDDPPGAVYPC